MSGRVRLELSELATEGGPRRVATLTLDAPERGNSLDAAMLARIEELLRGLPVDTGDTGDGAGASEGARALLVRGAGERAFCTGYHVPSLLDELERGLTVSDFEDHPLERALRALEEVPVPTIAVVDGHAYGAGCELALACDLRVAVRGARFCMPPAKLGVLYSATGMRRLLELTGPARTKELLFTGDPVDAERALAIGLANRVAAPDALEAEVSALTARIAGNAPLSVHHTKAVLQRYLAPPALSTDDLHAVAALREECFRSLEFRRRAARLGGREPRAE